MPNMFNMKRTPPKATLRSEQSISEPDLAVMPPVEINITHRKRKQQKCDHDESPSTIRLDLKKSLDEWKLSCDASLSAINNNITALRSDLDTCIKEIRNEMAEIRSEHAHMREQIANLTEEVTELKTSTQFVSNQYEDYSKRLQRLERRSVDSDVIQALEYKIDNLEQQARQSNLEISNLPEKRGENLTNLIEDIGKNINLTIPREEIVSIHRVPHAAANQKPKNIIVKLKTRILRDNVISAYRLKKGLTSTQLGISGAPHTIFVNEHLTLPKKQLLRETREMAKKIGYKFVWVKHATILVRQSETSPIIAIKSHNDIAKIKADKIK